MDGHDDPAEPPGTGRMDPMGPWTAWAAWAPWAHGPMGPWHHKWLWLSQMGPMGPWAGGIINGFGFGYSQFMIRPGSQPIPGGIWGPMDPMSPMLGKDPRTF